MRTEKKRNKTEENKTVSSSGEEDSDVERKLSLLEDTSEEEEEISLREKRDEARSQSGRDTKEDCGSSTDDGSGLEDEDDDEDDAALQTKQDIRKELSHMPFEDVMKLQQEVGTKAFNEAAFSSRKHAGVSSQKRLNKNRPVEISAKKAPSFLRQVIPVKKCTRRDPRFDSLSGEYKPEIFEKTYEFINELKHKEKEMIKKQLKKTKNSSRKERLQFLLRRLENQEKARRTQEQQRERELQFKKQQRERASRGERPFFLKKSEKKKLQLAEKYLDLKKSGKVEKFLSKKRKRNAMKDRRKLPEQLLSQNVFKLKAGEELPLQ